jgi:class 3 adenylate cyclase/tetratricopeptide (TPR) repeat protein
VRTCPNCGEENPDRFPLCGFCGTPFAAAPPPKEVRKTVTVVFSDLQGSTSLGERLDSESLREVMSRYFAAMSEALERHGGTIEKFIGDAVMAVFGLPRLHEDDALRAVRAAHAMQEALVSLNEDLERRYGVRLTNRTGVNTGEVVAGDPAAGQRLVTGDTVNVAARLEQAAGPNEVLLGDLTWRLVRDDVEGEPVAPLELKGKAERVPAHRLLALSSRPGRQGADDELPLVGRERELELLLSELEAVRASGRCRVATVLAQAGVGKSRLVGEVIARAAPGARALRGRCLSYGRGITFWPLVDVVQDAAGVQGDDPPEVVRRRVWELLGPDGTAAAERVAAAVGLSDAEYPVEEIFWGARKLLETVAAERPLVLVLEDLHWAELTFLDFVDHLRTSAEAPILVICGARPELKEIRSELRGEVIELGPLGPEHAAQLVEHRLGDAEIAPDVRRRIVEAADGNPLFVQQLLSMLVDEGMLTFEDGRWHASEDLAELRVPPTVNALISARLDQLIPAERAVIDPASVMGLVFYPPAVRALLDEAQRADVVKHLISLRRKQLVEPGPPDPLGDETYRFEHALVREAAYGALLKRERATLHERFVDWALSTGRPEELEEIVAYHLEQAHRYLSQLGPLDDHGRELGARAAALLTDSGRRAFAREDMPAAANLLRRAAQLMPPDEEARIALLPTLGEAFLDIGEFALAEAFLDEAVERAEARGYARLRARATLVRLLVRAQAGGQEDWADHIAREAEAVLPTLEAAGDDEGIATALRVVAWAEGTVCRYGTAARAAERAMDHAARAGDERQRRRAAVQYAVAATYGPVRVEEALPRLERILVDCRGDRRSEGVVMSLLARLEAMRGEIERARRLYRDARATLEEMGQSVVASSTSLDSCGVEMLAGDPAAAERELRRDHAALVELEETYLLSTVSGELAHVLCAQGRHEEAWELSEEAERLAASDDLVSQALWRSARARLLAQRGELELALAMGRHAVGSLDGTDTAISQADALLALFEVLAAAGQPDEAAACAEEAIELLERKGDRRGAAAARRRTTAVAR